MSKDSISSRDYSVLAQNLQWGSLAGTFVRKSTLRAADLGDVVTDDRHSTITWRQRGFGCGWTQGTPGCTGFVSVSAICVMEGSAE